MPVNSILVCTVGYINICSKPFY